jgi:hypothetical protein
MLALPIDKMLYIFSTYCVHTLSEHQKNRFQSKQSKHLHQENHETGSNKVKLWISLPWPWVKQNSQECHGKILKKFISIISKYYKYPMHALD